jgi:hypothetical protein
MIELRGGNPRGLLNLVGIGKALPSESIPSEEAPPALLQIEPARSSRNEDVLQTRMLSHPGPRLSTIVAGEVVGDHEDVALGIVSFDVSEQGNVVRRVARGGASSQFLAITHAERSIDPGFLGSATVVQGSPDAMPSGGPARSGREGAWDHWSQFVGADGRRAFGWLRVVADDCGSFGAKSSSLLVPQLCVRRQRTPSRRKMVRI